MAGTRTPFSCAAHSAKATSSTWAAATPVPRNAVESSNERNPKATKLEVSFTARVRLWVKTATANIDVTGVTGGLDLYVVSGTINVTGNPRELNAEAIDGDIHVTGSPPWVRVKSATGGITFRGSSANAALSTVSGPIRVEGGLFERAKIETVTGNIAFAGPLDRSGAFDFDTHAGTVDIAVPDKTNASFAVVTIARVGRAGVPSPRVRGAFRARTRSPGDGVGMVARR